MGLQNSRCDSCDEEVSFLFPLAVVDELPSGGEAIVLKYYCVKCYEIMADAAQTELDDTEEDEEEENGEDFDYYDYY